MATLNNENVTINDRVFDVAQGVGTVLDTSFNEITVRFDNGVRISYDSTGHYGGVRRLYWHNPVVLDPPKNIRLWDTLIACIKPTYAYLKGH